MASERPGTLQGRTEPRHFIAALLAVCLSLGIHWVTLQLLPPLAVGRPADTDAGESRRSVSLGGVHRRFDSKTERPAVFRPEDPGRVAEALAMMESEFPALRSDVDVSDLDAYAGDAPPLRAEDEALVPPQAEEPREGWTPRQDIVMIQDSLFAEDVSALPRRFTATAPRVADAVDVAWSIDQTAEETMRRVRPEVQSGLPVLDGGVSERLQRLGSGAGGEGLQAQEEAKWDEATSLLDEELAEVTDIEPVEALLDLDLHVFTSEDDGTSYFSIHIRRKGEEGLPVLPKDILLIQDCYESMTDAKLRECRKGLHRWIDGFTARDRFNIAGFRDDVLLFSPQWTPVTPLARSQARLFVEEMRSWGKTDVYASLQEVLALERTADRPVVAVLVTDGRPTMGTVDSSEIIEGFTQANGGDISVFTVGGGHRVNRFLLDLISFKNRGDSLVVRSRTDIPDALERWANQLSRPVLTHLTYHFVGADNAEVYPKSLSYLYLDRPLVVYGRTKSDQVVFQIVGRSGEKRHDMVFAVDLKGAAEGTSELQKKWAWHRIYDLIGEHLRTQEPELLAVIKAVADQYGLIVPYQAELSTE